MNSATCTALSAVFPLILITVVLERPRVSVKIRRTRWFRRLMLTTFAASLIGTALSVIGVQLDGFGLLAGTVLWLVLGVALTGLGAAALMIVATDEVEEDATA